MPVLSLSPPLFDLQRSLRSPAIQQMDLGNESSYCCKANENFRSSVCLLVALLAGSAAAYAAPVSVEVRDAAGQPIVDAVVYAEPVTPAHPPKIPSAVQIEQKARRFMPLVTAVQTGTSISFPNNDTVRHHVYSFSPAKTFELKLYSGEPANPQRFDVPGTVVVGCNIHDRMVAYIHVVATPYFAKTDAKGQVLLADVAAGKYRLKVWHFALPAGAPVIEQPLEVGTTGVSAAVTLNLKASG